MSDDAEIRKIKAVAKLVETNTNRLNTVVTMQELISSFKVSVMLVLLRKHVVRIFCSEILMLDMFLHWRYSVYYYKCSAGL